MKDENFEIVAKNIISYIAEEIENQDELFEAELDFKDGVLTIEIGRKIFVINKQSATNEIWLASPVSGPHHFKIHNDRWISHKKADLLNLLSEEVSLLLNRTITLL